MAFIPPVEHLGVLGRVVAQPIKRWLPTRGCFNIGGLCCHENACRPNSNQNHKCKRQPHNFFFEWAPLLHIIKHFNENNARSCSKWQSKSISEFQLVPCHEQSYKYPEKNQLACIVILMLIHSPRDDGKCEQWENYQGIVLLPEKLYSCILLSNRSSKYILRPQTVINNHCNYHHKYQPVHYCHCPEAYCLPCVFLYCGFPDYILIKCKRRRTKADQYCQSGKWQQLFRNYSNDLVYPP